MVVTSRAFNLQPGYKVYEDGARITAKVEDVATYRRKQGNLPADKENLHNGRLSEFGFRLLLRLRLRSSLNLFGVFPNSARFDFARCSLWRSRSASRLNLYGPRTTRYQPPPSFFTDFTRNTLESNIQFTRHLLQKRFCAPHCMM